MAVNISRPKAILFDWDNTLVDTWPIIHHALHHTFVEMGHEPWPLEKTKANVRKSMRDAFPEIFGEEWERAGSIYQRYYQATHLVQLKALPDAEKVLVRAREMGFFNAVVSNKKSHNLRKEVAHMGWDKYFDALVGSDDAAHDKPHCAPVNLALEKSGIIPGSDVWFVGDSVIDLECAQNTGCEALLYGETDADETARNYQGFRFSHWVRNHQELFELLNSVA